eukprot:358665-Prymnesium_polylepis.1
MDATHAERSLLDLGLPARTRGLYRSTIWPCEASVRRQQRKHLATRSVIHTLPTVSQIDIESWPPTASQFQWMRAASQTSAFADR